MKILTNSSVFVLESGNSKFDDTNVGTKLLFSGELAENDLGSEIFNYIMLSELHCLCVDFYLQMHNVIRTGIMAITHRLNISRCGLSLTSVPPSFYRILLVANACISHILAKKFSLGTSKHEVEGI